MYHLVIFIDFINKTFILFQMRYVFAGGISIRIEVGVRHTPVLAAMDWFRTGTHPVSCLHSIVTCSRACSPIRPATPHTILLIEYCTQTNKRYM